MLFCMESTVRQIWHLGLLGLETNINKLSSISVCLDLTRFRGLDARYIQCPSVQGRIFKSFGLKTHIILPSDLNLFEKEKNSPPGRRLCGE